MSTNVTGADGDIKVYWTKALDFFPPQRSTQPPPPPPLEQSGEGRTAECEFDSSAFKKNKNLYKVLNKYGIGFWPGSGLKNRNILRMNDIELLFNFL